MRTIAEALRGVNAYPVPPRTLVAITTKRGLDPAEELTSVILRSAPYKLCKADLLMWLSLAPDVTQGGQSYSFSDEQRNRLRAMAQQIYDELEEDGLPKTLYGYKGKRL